MTIKIFYDTDQSIRQLNIIVDELLGDGFQSVITVILDDCYKNDEIKKAVEFFNLFQYSPVFDNFKLAFIVTKNPSLLKEGCLIGNIFELGLSHLTKSQLSSILYKFKINRINILNLLGFYKNRSQTKSDPLNNIMEIITVSNKINRHFSLNINPFAEAILRASSFEGPLSASKNVYSKQGCAWFVLLSAIRDDQLSNLNVAEYGQRKVEEFKRFQSQENSKIITQNFASKASSPESAQIKKINWGKEWHSIPQYWSDRQLSKFLRADELAQNARNYLSAYYTGKAPPLGAITLGEKKASSEAGLLSYASDDHLLTIAPSRAGKGTCQIVPTLLTYKGSALVVDIKGENHAITAHARANMPNSRVYRFAPFSGDGDRFNPLDFITTDHTAYSTCRFLSEMLIPSESGHDSFWVTEARNLLAVFLLFVRTSNSIAESDRTMAEVVDQSTNPAGISETLEQMKSEDENLVVQQVAGSFDCYDEKVKEGVRATLNSALQPWLDENVQDATAASDFDFLDLKKSMSSMNERERYSTTIYLCFPPETLRAYRNVLRVMVGIAIFSMTRELPKHQKWLRKPALSALFILDELPALGYMPPVLDGLGYLAGYGGQIWAFAQAIGQLRAIYGDAWQVFMTSAGAFSAFNINDVETSEYISRLLGKTDEYLQDYTVMEESEVWEYLDTSPHSTNDFAHQRAAQLRERGYEEDTGRYKRDKDGYATKAYKGYEMKPRKRNRWTQDDVGPPNLVRQLGDRFMFVFLKGQSGKDGLKPALVRKVPYYQIDSLKKLAGSWSSN